jgi:hypothetical protein
VLSSILPHYPPAMENTLKELPNNAVMARKINQSFDSSIHAVTYGDCHIQLHYSHYLNDSPVAIFRQLGKEEPEIFAKLKLDGTLSGPSLKCRVLD